MRQHLILEPGTLDSILVVVEHAESMPIDLETLKAMEAGRVPPGGADPNRVIVVPVGFRCAFSIEQQPAGWCRHLSVSCPDRPGVFPHPFAVAKLACVFGLKTVRDPGDLTRFEDMPEVNRAGLFGDAGVYVVQDSRAVNLIEPIER